MVASSGHTEKVYWHLVRKVCQARMLACLPACIACFLACLLACLLEGSVLVDRRFVGRLIVDRVIVDRLIALPYSRTLDALERSAD